MVKYTYENVIKSFEDKKCKLLTTAEEYYDMCKQNIKYKKYKYIASCNHEHIVFHNVFLNRNSGVICPSCTIKQNSIKASILNNNDKLCNIKTEYDCIQIIFSFLNNLLDIKKAFDGCSSDIIFKPKNITYDKWVGIQVKTNNKVGLGYNFNITKNYTDYLIICMCLENKKMWIIPFDEIKNKLKISIGINKSKYNIYEVNENNLFDRLNEYYHNTTKFSFEKLDTPNCIYQQREKEFRKFREEKIDFIIFEYDNMEGTVYDFKIGSLKIQEKVTKISEDNKCIFQLCKNNGKINGKRNQIQYDIGDNDFYWLNSDNKKSFFVIPEKILIDKGLVGNNSDKKSIFLKITIKEVLHKLSDWLQPYMFDYENIDKERLLSILG